MNQSTTNELQYRGINRTICIGLGGTGRDVLMRIRRLIVDRYGDLSNLPIVSFVHIDTDKAATQVTGIHLVKLRQFVKEVDEFPEDSANYPYKAAVVGTPTSTDPVAKEGIINRFRRKMNERFKSYQIQSRDIGNRKAILGEIVVDFPVESIVTTTKI